MNQKNYNLTELLNERQTFESLIGDKGGKENVAEANTTEGIPSSSKNKMKKNQGNKKGKGKKKIQKNKQNKTAPKPRGKCFHYN